MSHWRKKNAHSAVQCTQYKMRYHYVQKAKKHQHKNNSTERVYCQFYRQTRCDSLSQTAWL